MPDPLTGSSMSPPDRDDGDEAAGSDAIAALTRVTINLRRSAVVALDRLVAATGDPKTDIINHRVLVLAVLYDIMIRNGGSVTVLMDNGDIERIHIL